MGAGIQLYLSSGKRGSGSESEYYKWEYVETWKFSVQELYSFVKPYWYCWKTVPSSNYYVGSSEGFSQNVISNQPLDFISTETNRLFYRYSINVFQYSMNRHSYQYFKQLKEQLENKSSLFEKTPVVLNSNISCLSNKNEVVLGYFEVSEVDSTRIFIDKKELTDDFLWTGLVNYDSECYKKKIPISQKDDIDLRLVADTVVLIIDGRRDTSLIYHYSRTCFDCTTKGFPNVPPDYWKE
ncbi:MAG: DUF4249 family protein [Bacteroidales bacterium]|nr:DUF4249 family protein [Bacteroidales bacterium]